MEIKENRRRERKENEKRLKEMEGRARKRRSG